jgi:spore coat polysaccharide biosynthesis protein SpsF
MKIAIIVEARMTSTRLPGKVLLKVKGKSMLEHLITRLKKVRKVNEIIIATTNNKLDDKIVREAKNNKIKFYRGSELNVLDRVIKAAKKFSIDIIVRVTSDCPIIDVSIIDQAISIFLNNKCDYVSNGFIRSYPDGMDVDVLLTKTLIKSTKYAKDKQSKEHVNLAIRRRPKIFSHYNLIAPYDCYWPELGLTLDTIEDFKLIKKIISYFYNKNYFFSCLDVIKILKIKKWYFINKKILRTEYDYSLK